MIRLGSEVVGQSHFGDNALHLILPNPDGWTITWLYENDAELFTLICLRRHFDGIDMKLHMPYCPHAPEDAAIWEEMKVRHKRNFHKMDTIRLQAPHRINGWLHNRVWDTN